MPRFPELVDVIPAYRFDEHDSVVELSNQELERAVERAGGMVLIGLKSPAAPRSRVARASQAITRAEVLAARGKLREAGVEPYMTFRYSSAVAARIAPEQVRALRALSVVDFIEPDQMGRVETSLAPNQLSGQDTTWGVEKIRAPEVWLGSQGPSTSGQWVHVTILDTGLDETHRFLGDGPQPNGSCLYTEQSVDPAQGPHCYANSGHHGAFMGGIIAASDNFEGIIGVAPELQGFTSIKVCKSENECSTVGLLAALDWIIHLGHPRHIVNISLGWCKPFGKTLRSTLQTAANAGILIVAAAGNAWSDVNECEPGGDIDATGVKYPARYPEVMAVSGTTQADGFPSPPPYGGGVDPPEWNPCPEGSLDPECPTNAALGCSKGSRYGAQIEIAAPYFTRSLGAGGTYAQDCGTSASAAFVSGAAALVWSRNPTSTATEVRNRLKEHAVYLGSPSQFGAGRVDVVASAYASPPPPPPPPPLAVQILGPDFITSPGYHTWSASASGGVGPYAYAWGWAASSSGPFTSLGTSSSVQMLVNEGSVHEFWLRLDVSTDTETAGTIIKVTNETNNPCAPLVCLVSPATRTSKGSP